MPRDSFFDALTTLLTIGEKEGCDYRCAHGLGVTTDVPFFEFFEGWRP